MKKLSIILLFVVGIFLMYGVIDGKSLREPILYINSIGENARSSPVFSATVPYFKDFIDAFLTSKNILDFVINQTYSLFKFFVDSFIDIIVDVFGFVKKTEDGYIVEYPAGMAPGIRKLIEWFKELFG